MNLLKDDKGEFQKHKNFFVIQPSDANNKREFLLSDHRIRMLNYVIGRVTVTNQDRTE